MKINQAAKATGTSEPIVKPNRLAYMPPVLRVYGSVGKITRGALGTRCDGKNPGSNNPKTGGVCVSDRAAKQDIVRIGTHPAGFGLYLFDYRPELRAQWGADRQFGVMADEVEAVMPEAVSIHASGYKQVNYAMLGISQSV